jgi:hypothetical protein
MTLQYIEHIFTYEIKNVITAMSHYSDDALDSIIFVYAPSYFLISESDQRQGQKAQI